MRKETRLKSQSQIDHPTSLSESAFVVGQPAATSRPQFVHPSSGEVICHFCRDSGHVQIHCKKMNFCNYCKRTGHIVLACPTLSKKGRLRPAHSGHSWSHGAAYLVTLSSHNVRDTARLRAEASSQPI
ncbi:unnamed protein product [Linum trigynum]|uniref:CCHC-type domain-containing protein n=1 Tax=Linum trigynum TaxID=586398 RepID=A0AAV2GBR0_9ROSI